jgi:hypothetical protein
MRKNESNKENESNISREGAKAQKRLRQEPLRLGALARGIPSIIKRNTIVPSEEGICHG